MKNEYTPGPWQFKAGEESNGIEYEGFLGSIVNDKEGDHVAAIWKDACSNNLEDQAESEANARLIAAAPELLDALEDLLMICDNSTPILTEYKRERIIEVINKATGGNS